MMDHYHTRKLRHYCGRFIGQDGYHEACGSCDGRCGPNNGCQCESCYNYDLVHGDDDEDEPSACGPKCRESHNGSTCVVCKKDWGVHSGHNCPNTSLRGSFLPSISGRRRGSAVSFFRG